MSKTNKYHKITNSAKEVVFTNDPKEIAAAQKQGFRIDDIGILTEEEISRYKSRGIEIVELSEKTTKAKAKTKPKETKK